MGEFKIEDKIDKILEGKPEALKRVRDNRMFIKTIKNQKVKKDKENVKVFGVRDVNINAILKDNIWNRSIFTTDKLCRLFLGANLEQLKKYEKKKRIMPMNFGWILLLMVGIVIAILVLIFLLPKIGKVI